MERALFLATGWVIHTGAGGVPFEMVFRYGLTPSCMPTGRTMIIEGIEFVEIGAGTFVMGSGTTREPPDRLYRACDPVGLPWGRPGALQYEMPVHTVEFPRGYWIARHEVTNEQFRRFMAEHRYSRYEEGDQDPVVGVSWEDARAYSAWLGERVDLPIRLPTEAEWEASCRAGTASGSGPGEAEADLVEVAWYIENHGDGPGEVGTRKPNAWGLYDMHGNVWEWCQDTVHLNYEGAPSDGSPWIAAGVPKGLPSRIMRGGGWISIPERLRCATRSWGRAGTRLDSLGFRLAMGPLDD